VFVHNAGNGGLGGRNGTRELIEAMKHVISPIKLIIRSQVLIQDVDDPRIEIRVGTFEDIWSEGDVFIFPEKFNGLSLPLQEAFASGMLVIAGDRFPINDWLPKEPLIPVDSYVKERIAVEFDSARYTPSAIAAQIDRFYDKNISNYSELGRKFANKYSWKNLRAKYETVLSPL
jgi:glycosyltransferase involved in cell wall biosynthesis